MNILNPVERRRNVYKKCRFELSRPEAISRRDKEHVSGRQLVRDEQGVSELSTRYYG